MFRLLPRKTSLRMRVMVYCAALGGAIGICMAFVAEAISDHNELLLVNEEMEAELGVQIAEHGEDPDDSRLPRGPWKSVYIDRRNQPPTSPTWAQAMPPGVTELDPGIHGKDDRFIAIRDTPIGRVTMIAGLPDSPARERRFAEELAAMVLLGVILGGWLGRMLAGSMLSPVLRLSHEVDRADPGADLHGIADDHRSDEVGALANAFIRYQGRVNAAIEREVLFSADAGHELRTPLSVLNGALDLLDAQTVQAPARRRIERIRRSAAEIGLLLDALTLLARPEESRDAEPRIIDLTAVLGSVVGEFRDELAAAGIALRLRCPPDAVVHAPSGLPRTAFRLLLRSIAGGAWGERLCLEVDANAVALRVAEASADDPAKPAEPNPGSPLRSDESGGLGMLRRLCERYGWAFHLNAASSDGSLVAWTMPSNPVARANVKTQVKTGITPAASHGSPA
ncbi:MAG: HAMP domain-containing histidine kinase [Proteobacteria bacterium]|nr:HAMP domain-containing histidine kinase [Pseudomonadota bacterium]